MTDRPPFEEVLRRFKQAYLSHPGVVAIAEGGVAGNSSDPSLLVFSTAADADGLPRNFQGYPVQVVQQSGDGFSTRSGRQ